MTLLELLNKLLNLMEKTSEVDCLIHQETWANIGENGIIFVSHNNIEEFNIYVENIYSINKKISTKFTRKNIYKYITDKVVEQKRNQNIFTEEIAKEFFIKLEQQEPRNRYIIAPISGIRLDNIEKINISIFEIGKTNSLESILSYDAHEYYIAVKINDIYDDLFAIEEAKNKFLDFIRLIIFLSVRNDKKILIKIGLPSYPSISHEEMYIETSSYHITKNIKNKFPSKRTDDRYLEKISVDDDFFCKNKNFIKLWEIYERKNSNKKPSEMEMRLLNSSIAIGESALSVNIKNSIIYTSMALEILFSSDKGSLFQKSIADKLADTFAFIIGKDTKSRLDAIALVKKFYGLRSDLVHGRDAKINRDYIVINRLLSTVIDELLNNEKYKNIKKIKDLYSMVKDAQNSY